MIWSLVRFKEEVKSHFDHLYNFIYKSMNFSEEAQDIFQETIFRAVKYHKSFNSKKSLKNWLFSIAYNEIRNYYRSEKQNLSFEDTRSVTDNFQEINKQLLLDVYDLAKTLNPQSRKVFFLFYYNGFSISDISGITGLKGGNIKFILHKARKSIRDKLKITEVQI